MNTERPEVVSKRRASPFEGEPARKRTKRTVEIPGLFGDVVQSPLPWGHQDRGPGVQDLEDGGGDAQVLDQVDTEC